MVPRRRARPLEMVVSAIQCLSEEKTWPAQEIIKYLVGKYGLDPDRLAPYVCEGIRRGLESGVLTRRSGLFRINHALIESLKRKQNTNREKLRKLKALLRRERLKKSRSVCQSNCQLHKNLDKMEAYRNYRRSVFRHIRNYKKSRQAQYD